MYNEYRSLPMNHGRARAYVTPSITDFGKVSVVTGAVGMTFLTDAAFTGSMFGTNPGEMGITMIITPGMGM
jgi:hypothetical protein